MTKPIVLRMNITYVLFERAKINQIFGESFENSRIGKICHYNFAYCCILASYGIKFERIHNYFDGFFFIFTSATKKKEEHLHTFVCICARESIGFFCLMLIMNDLIH